MRVFLPTSDSAAGKALVCCPGGGYAAKAIMHEGYDWAPFFNGQGIALAVVDYKLPEHDPERVIKDVDRAFKVMADSASGWGFSPDSIGIMGSSAGGHLASVMASSPHSGSRPAFQLLFYPVITLDKAYTHSGTRHNFLPESADDAMAARFSSENNVTASTPPAFIVH
ncbi:MAG: alpha/beta hydrolase, partial [Muribaculaceae bacterium]|nr:alpha/beta hydrolase [Muribaculaceae bacterium]